MEQSNVKIAALTVLRFKLISICLL